MTDSKDWTGNKVSVYKTLAASNHSSSEREKNDFYATDPKAIDLLLEKEKFSDLIWEPACGQGHLSKRLEQNGYEVLSTDLIDRGFGIAGVNFLNQGSAPAGCDIITNPPYKFAVDFTIRALNLLMMSKFSPPSLPMTNTRLCRQSLPSSKNKKTSLLDLCKELKEMAQ